MCSKKRIQAKMEIFESQSHRNTSLKASRALWDNNDYSEPDFSVAMCSKNGEWGLTRHALVRGRQRGLSDRQIRHADKASGFKTQKDQETSRKMITTYIPNAWKSNAGQYHVRAELKREETQAAYDSCHFKYIMVPSYARRKMQECAASCMVEYHKSDLGNDPCFECKLCYGGSVFTIKGCDVLQVQCVYDDAKAIVDKARAEEDEKRRKREISAANFRARSETKRKAKAGTESKPKTEKTGKSKQEKAKRRYQRACSKEIEENIQLKRIELQKTESSAVRKTLLKQIHDAEKDLHSLIWR